MDLTPSPPPNNNSIIINTVSPAVMAMPGTQTIVGPTRIYMSAPSNDAVSVGFIQFDDLKMPVNQESQIQFPALINITNPVGLFEIIKSIKAGNTTLVGMTSDWTISLYGITWYKDFRVSSKMNMSSVAGQKLVKVVTNMIMSGLVPGVTPAMIAPLLAPSPSPAISPPATTQ